MVTLAYIALNVWHVSPDVVYDMPETLIYDVIRRQNLQSAVDDSDDVFYDPEKIQDLDEDIPTESTRFKM